MTGRPIERCRPACGASRLLRDRWRLLSWLHRGQSSHVFRAAAAAEPQEGDYIVKLARCDARRDLAIAQLEREVQVALAVEHEHLAPAADWSFRAPPYFLVRPYLYGPTVAQLGAAVPTPLPLALWIARQVADALQALHAAGWMHGDVAARNVVVGPSGHATLIDLGAAHRVEAAAERRQWIVTGPAEATAPEVRRGGPYGTAADVYGLGAMLRGLLDRDALAGSLAHRLARWVEQRLLSPLPERRATAEQARRELVSWELTVLGAKRRTTPRSSTASS